MDLHLKREIQFFAPQIVFCFGRRVKSDFGKLASQIISKWLYHPAYIAHRAQTSKFAKEKELANLGKTERKMKAQERLIQENDVCIERCLEQLQR